MFTYESPCKRQILHFSWCNIGLRLFVFPNQTVSTKKEEQRHSIMTKERQEMYRQQPIWVRQHSIQPIDILLKKLVFVLPDNAR